MASNELSREEALNILRNVGTPENVIEHCKVVSEYAKKFAEELKKRGIEVDVHTVEIGALLHDIGRSRTHGIDHGVEGGKILRSLGLEKYARMAERHIFAGVSKEEARGLGLPPKDYLPETLEEKIVAYVDDLIKDTRFIGEEEALRRFERILGKGHSIVSRIRTLFEEMHELYGGPFSP